MRKTFFPHGGRTEKRQGNSFINGYFAYYGVCDRYDFCAFSDGNEEL